MVEVAISLAIIGIALVAIIGVLPLGMNVQRDNREATVINQDATFFLEAIRNGARGLDDLTNYVYAITNSWAQFNSSGMLININADGYSLKGSHITRPIPGPPFFPLTNGLRIIGLLSTPQFTDLKFAPTNNVFHGGYSNHIVAYVRSLSGPAVEKPPQTNDIVRGDAFTYFLYAVNAPVATDTNVFNLPTAAPGRVYASQLAANLHDLRLTFLWPVRPNGRLGTGRQTFRALVAGQIYQTNSLGQPLYFYQSQSFTNAP